MNVFQKFAAAPPPDRKSPAKHARGYLISNYMVVGEKAKSAQEIEEREKRILFPETLSDRLAYQVGLPFENEDGTIDLTPGQIHAIEACGLTEWEYRQLVEKSR